MPMDINLHEQFQCGPVRDLINHPRTLWSVCQPNIRAINAISFKFDNDGGHTMSKSKDQKKMTKKEPAKTPKEKKEAKKVKKEERKRQ